MVPHSEGLVFGTAAAFTVFGVVVWRVRRRKGDRWTGPELLAGMPGVYLGFLVSMGATKWLYIPCAILLASAVVMQFVIEPRHEARELAAHGESDDAP